MQLWVFVVRGVVADIEQQRIDQPTEISRVVKRPAAPVGMSMLTGRLALGRLLASLGLPMRETPQALA